MINANATIGRPARGFDARTRHWYFRVAGAEGLRHMHYLNQLMMRGRAGTAWLEVPGELLMLGGASRAVSLEGWKDFYHSASATEHAVINYYPLLGVRAAEGALDAYIDLEVLPADWPGVELDHQSIGVLVTSNRPGAYNDAGATGTGGLMPLMLRASSGFRGGVWLCAGQVIQGGSNASGWHMGSRLDHNTGFGRSQNMETLIALPAVSLPNQTINLLSAEPSVGNSPNQLLAFWLGGSLTSAQAAQQQDDLMTYVRDIGTWAGVDTGSFILGPHCFGPNSINQIIPADLRVMRQRPPPPDDITPGTAYIGYPMTGVWARFYQMGTKAGPLDDGYLVADPFAVAIGSPVITVKHAAHGLVPLRDIVEYTGAVAGSGLADGDLNRRFIVETTPTADTYTVRTGVNASATVLAMGGATVHAFYRVHHDEPTTFSFPRGSTFDCFIWSCRGNRDAPGEPITAPTRPNSTEGTPITRRTAGPGGSPPAGIVCRPGYELKREAAGATVVQFMWVADCLARNDLRITTLWDGDVRPTGWGYLDVAEKYGLDAAKVIPVNEAWVRADELFLTPVAGFATSYGYVLLQNGQMHNAPNQPVAKKAIIIDLEHADFRSPDLLEEMLFDCNQCAAALGFTWSWGGHYITEPFATSNAWTLGNLRRVQEYSNFRGHNILAVKRADPAAMVASLQAQVDRCRGEAENLPILYNKFVLSYSLGVGQQAVPLDQCAAAGAWAREKGIKEVHIRRAGQFEGGVQEHFWNQQTIAYLPNLSAAIPPPPATAQAALDAWLAAVVAAGDPLPSIGRQGLILELLSPLYSADIFPNLELFTLFANQTDITARMDLRLLAMGTLVSTASLVPDRWLLTDGVSGYYNHNWAPTASLNMTLADQMLAVYVKDEISLGSTYAAGTLLNAGQGSALRLGPDTAANATVYLPIGAAGFENSSIPGGIAEPDVPGAGLFWVQRNASSKEFGKNGSLGLAAAITTPGPAFPTANLYTGCTNQNTGVPTGFKAGKRLATIVGKHLTPAQMQTLSDALTQYFTAIGALP